MIKDNNGVFEKWKFDKKLKDLANEKDADKYIRYSFRRDFKLNGKEDEIYEPPKILGDVFESLVGAIFRDGGIEQVVRVYQHLLAPFVLFVAKFSKKLYKEPKEDFLIFANLLKIKPLQQQRSDDIRIWQLKETGREKRKHQGI